MPTKVYETLEIELSDGTALTIKPLTIKSLKKFLRVVEKLQSDEIASEADAVDIFLEAGLVCMEQFAPDKFTSIDDIETIFEMPTLMKVLEIAGGLKLGPDDPNLLAAGLDGMI